MKPQIDETEFGSITIAGVRYQHDVLIRANGTVEKRKKKLSKEIYGTSHVISLAEAEYTLEEGASWIIIGTGQSGMVTLSAEATRYFEQKNTRVILEPTPEAILSWNEGKGNGVGLFHVTC